MSIQENCGEQVEVLPNRNVREIYLCSLDQAVNYLKKKESSRIGLLEVTYFESSELTITYNI